MTDPTYRFSDASGLARWSIGLLYIQAALAAVAVWSGWQEYQLLHSLEGGLTEDAMARATENDRRQQAIGIAQAALFVVNGILILMWIFRANANVRALGAVRMDYTPAWAVGWYFVPFANLAMPYLALKDVWKASARPHDPPGARGPGIVFPLWWTLWLSSNIAANVGFRLALEAETLSEIEAANIAILAGDALSIPLCLIFPAIITQIQRMQAMLAAGDPAIPSSAPA